MPDPNRINVSPQQVFQLALGVSFILVALHFVGLFFKYGLGQDYVMGFVPLFDLNMENNAPTLITSIMLFFAGLLCFLAANVVTRFRVRWWLIGFTLIALGVDETFGLHEPLFRILRGNQSTKHAALADSLGGLTFLSLAPWLTIIFVSLCAWYWPLARSVQRRVLYLAIGAAVSYLLAVIVIDQIVLVLFEHRFSIGVIVGLTTLEEILELLGVCLFLYAVTDYIAGAGGSILRLSARDGVPVIPQR